MYALQAQINARRGFMPFFGLGVTLCLIGIGWFSLFQHHEYLYLRMMGLFLVALGGVILYTTERTSRPPLNHPSIFCRDVLNQPAGIEQNQRLAPARLVCLGDSLTHGTCSGNVVDRIVPQLLRYREYSSRRPPATSQQNYTIPSLFDCNSPLWVVNAGQNSVCSLTTRQERIGPVLKCNPDFVVLWIGTNDLRGVYSKRWSNQLVGMWNLSEAPTLHGLEQNLEQILLEMLPAVKQRIAVCTLPPMGEDLTHPANRLVKHANTRIEQTVARIAKHSTNGNRVILLPLYEALETVIRARGTQTRMPLPVDYFLLVSPLMGVLYHIFGVSWNRLGSLIGNVVLSDSLHLNERGRDVVTDIIVSWLIREGVSS